MQVISPSASLENFWSLSTEEALKDLSCSNNGLTTPDVAKRLKQYGYNTFKTTSSSSTILLFLQQFKSPVTLLLIAAALLSMGLGDFTNAVIIIIIILISSFLGFWQEKGAANAVSALLKMVQIKCRIKRDGNEIELPVENVVPGDIILLSAGDVIPADSLLLDSKELFIDEAAFTGETYPVEKICAIVPATATLAKRSNSLFMDRMLLAEQPVHWLSEQAG